MASDGDTLTLLLLPAQAGQTSGPTGAKPPPGRPMASGAAATATVDEANAAANAVLSAAPPGHSAFRAPPVAKPTSPPVPQPELQSRVAQLNKHLNDSGRPNQFRVDPRSSTMIQEVNPATGEVIGQFSASEFPALARSAGAASGLLIDRRA